MRTHIDHRRIALCNLFDQPEGDTNLFIVQPGQRTCWHRHKRQTDQFRVLKGEMVFRKFVNPSFVTEHHLDSPALKLTVQPGEWHGYENIGAEPAYLLMYLDQHYDETDEERSDMPWDAAYAPGWSDGQGSDGWGDNG